MSSITAGNTVYQVTVDEIIPSRAIANCLVPGTSSKLPVPLIPMRSRMPQVGEVWLIDKQFGNWSFAALIQSPNIFTGSSAVHGDGSPVGVVTPIGVGQNYIDDAKTGGVSQWIATGTTDQDWSVLGGDVGQLSQQVTTLQTTLNQTTDAVTANQAVLNTTTQTLTDTQNSLTQAQADIAASQQQLSNNNAALATAQDTLATTTTELAQTQSDLTAAQAQLDAANADIAANTASLTTANQTLSTAQDNIAAAQATLAQHSHDLYDPTGVVQTSEDVLAGNITTAQNAADSAQSTANAAQQAANDASGAAALATTAAQNAASLADGKAVVFVQAAAPTSGMSLNDLWVNTSDGNAVYIYTGSPLAWGKYQDQSIGTALDNAAIANNLAAGAQATADRKITTYYDGPSRTNLAPTPGNGGTSTNSAKYPISLDAATVHYSSGGSIKATPSSPAAGDPTVASLTGLGGLTPVPYTPSATYTVSYWVLASSVANLSATATITATPSGGSAVVTPGTAMTITANDIEWTQVSVTATMPATAGSWVPSALVKRVVGNAVTADTVWITDVLIEKAATVGSFITGTSVEPVPPTGGFTLGDLWVNTSNGNHLWRWDGTQWESAQDSAIEAAQAAADAASNSAATAITSAQTAQSTADGKAVVFYQAAAPTTGMSLNDIWINSASGNVVNRYNGTAWVLAQDQSIGTALANAATANNIATGAQATADRKITTYYATSTPTAPTGGFTVGDLWVDEADDNHLFRWDGTQWGDARDKTIAAAQAAADSAATSAQGALTSAQNAASLADKKAVVFFQSTQPTTGMSLNDVWIDSANGNLVHIYSGTAWTVAQDQQIGAALANAATANNLASGAQATADRKITTYYESGTPPTPSGGFTIGDMWVNEADKNHLWRWSGTAWVDVRDATIAEAQAKADAAANTAANAVTSAQTAQSTADGKAVLFYQPTTPSGDLNDMWLDTGHGNIVKICTNPPTGWTAAQDQSISTALANAQTANNLAAGAQATANLKITTYFNGPGRTNLCPNPATGGNTNNGADWTISVDASTTHFESAGSLKSVPKVTTQAYILSNYSAGGVGTSTPYTAGATYTVSAWVKVASTAATTAYLKINYTPSGGSLTSVAGTVVSIPASATGWYQVSVTATMPATAGVFYPNAFVNRASGNATLTDAAWITDQMLEKSDTVGSFIVGTDTPPSPPDGGFTIGDMWINTTDKNHPYRWDGQQWDDVRDATIADAQAKADAAATTASTAVTSAQTAQSTADGKAVIFFQKTAPTGEKSSDVNDIWIDSSNGNRVNLWSGTAWVVAQDQSISTALTNAQTATNLANGAQATANLKITTYYTTTAAQSGISHGPTAPTGGFTSGDMWVDQYDKNHPYRWSGSAWTDVRDVTISDAQAAANAAAATASTAVTSAQTAQSTADGKAQVFFSSTAPTGEKSSDVNDIWIDSSNGNRVNLWSGTAWTVAQDQSIGTALANAATATNLANGAQATANLKTTTYYTTTSAQSGISHGPTAPTGGFTTGDLWVDQYDNNHPYRWSGTAWTDVRDATIAAAQSAANAAAAQAGTAITSAQTAQSTADGKAVVFFQATAPTGEKSTDINDIWIDTSNGNRVNLWSGTAWVVAQDQSISTALTNAAAANTAASGAQSTADAASTAASNAQNAANAAQSTANTANSAALTAAGIASTKGQVFFGTAAPTVLQRVNLCTNPTFGTATTGWGMYGGVGGAASLTRQSGTDTPRGTAGYGRMTWTAASTNGGGIVWGTPGSSTGAPVSANTTYTFSAWIRSSKAISITPQVQFYNGATATIDQGGVATALAANTWTRVSFTTTSGANDTLGQPRFYAAAGTTFAVGNTLDLDDVLIEASSTLGTYFDGAATPGDPSYVYAWTGTANASTSGQYSAVTLWIDTTSGNNTPKKFTPPSTWAAITDVTATNAASAASAAATAASNANTAASNAQTAANAAQATANLKITTYYVASPATPVPPSGGFTAGDLWIDTGNHSQVSRWSGTAWVLTDLASQSYISSRGTDLVTNGTGYLGTNYNFSGFNFTSADAPPGSSGSFLMTTSGYLGSKFSDELIPVNTGKSYVLSAWARETASAGASYFYAGFACYDAFKQSIAPSHYVYTAGTDTTLAADLKPGDTTAQIVSATGWRTTSPYNYLTVWNYVDPGGQVWPQHTYSRWSLTFTAISTNTLTLSAAWPAAYGTIPAGTPVSNGQSGGTYQYAVASHATAPTTWTQFTSVAITGTADGTKGSASTSFVPGTANIKFLFLPHYTGTATDARQAFGGISMSDAAAAQLAATNAQATASGKNTTYWGTVAASGTTPGLKVNDVYYQYSLVSGKFSIIAMWQWNGTAWQTAALNETFLPQVNIGTGTYGTLDGGRLTATSVTATQIAGNTITATQIKGGTITSNEINAQSVAGAVGTFISLDVGQLTATGTSTLATAVIQKISANVLVANSITSTQITSGAVTGDKVDANTVAAKIGSFLSIDVGQLTATGTSTLATAVIQKISAGVLVANSITSAQIVSGSITGDRLNASTINAAIGSFLTIDVAQLTATGTSHFATIVANQMFTDIFSANKITAAQIQANTITATQIYGGTITATQINASSVAAAVGTFVQVKAENIQAGTVNSNLVMGATLTGGTPGGARVDIGTLGTGITGLRQYDANNNVIVDMTNGSATFTGAISGGSASFPAGAGVSGGGFYADQSNMQYGVDTTTNLCPNPAVASLTGVTAIGSGTNIAVGQAPSQNSWTNWDYGGPNMLSTALKVWNTTLASGTASVVLGAAQPSTQYTVSFYSAIGMVDGSTPGNQELDVLWANLKVTRADTAAVVAATPTGYGAIGGNLPGLWSPMAAGGLQGSSGLSNGAANIGMGGWSYRWFFTFTTPSNLPANTNLLLNLPVATTKAGAATATLAAFYGAFQMEAKPGMTRYCDGNQASCLWSGTANASTSVRNGFSGLYTGSWTDPRVIGTLQTDYLKSSKMKLGSGSLRGTNYTQVWQPSSWTLLQNGGYHTLTYSASNTSRISNDDGAIFDGASTFTAPVAGIYAYSTMASLTSLPTAGANDLILMDCMTSSGAIVNRCMWSRTYLATQNVSVTGLVWANAGDSFYFRIWQNLAGSSTLSGNASGTPNLAYFALIA